MSLAVLILLTAQAGAASTQAASIDGKWINPAKSVIIDIAPCGDKRCGVVEWASDSAKADARKNAPQLVGTPLLTGLSPASAAMWRGRIFVPDRNIKASAKINVLGPDQIKVTGCALGGILCDSQVWSRTEGSPPPAN